MDDVKRKQVSDQCPAIAHLAEIISKVHSGCAYLFASGSPMMTGLEDQVGERTACLLDYLGDVLNGMDAVDDGDEWIGEVLRMSREIFPEKDCPVCCEKIPHDEHGTSMGVRYHIQCLPKFEPVTELVD